MASFSEVTFINHEKAVVGYGDTKDLAFNDLLEKLRVHESKLKCTDARASEDEVCQPFLNPPISSSSAVTAERVLAKFGGSAKLLRGASLSPRVRKGKPMSKSSAATKR